MVILELDLYHWLLQDGPLTREELMDRVQKPRTTVYDALKKLMTMGFVSSYERKVDSGIGGPCTFFQAIIKKEGL